jgi:hypothetical protein
MGKLSCTNVTKIRTVGKYTKLNVIWVGGGKMHLVLAGS